MGNFSKGNFPGDNLEEQILLEGIFQGSLNWTGGWPILRGMEPLEQFSKREDNSLYF